MSSQADTTDSRIKEERSASKWRLVATIVAVAIFTPFLVTGLSHVLDLLEWMTWWGPLLVVALLGIALFLPKKTRPIGLGLVIGTAVFTVALMALFIVAGQGMDKIG